MSERPQNKHLKPFPKGVSGNPLGKPKQTLTKDKVASVLGKFADSTREQLQAIITNPKSTMLEIMVASVMARAAKDGDPNRLEFLLQRSIGKVADIQKLGINVEDYEALASVPTATLLQAIDEPK